MCNDHSSSEICQHPSILPAHIDKRLIRKSELIIRLKIKASQIKLTKNTQVIDYSGICIDCNQSCKIYPKSEGKCWPCLNKVREKNMILKEKCNKKGKKFCNDEYCLYCYRRSLY